MQRRHLIAALGLALPLGACGFRLRGNQSYAFRTLAITPEIQGAFAALVARHLGDMVVPLAPPPGGQAPDVILDILQEIPEKMVIGYSATGQVREYQLRLRVLFRVRTPQGRELLPATEIRQQRDISFNESAALAKESEEGLLNRDMQGDLVQQLLRRLAAIKMPE